MSRKKYDHDKIKALFEKYRNTGTVASIVGCNVSTVRAVVGPLGRYTFRSHTLPHEHMRSLHRHGLCDREIANEAEVDTDSVVHWRLRKGMTPNPRPTYFKPPKAHRLPKVGRARKYSMEVAEDLIVRQKMPSKDVAVRLGVDIDTVYRLRKHFGVSKPHPMTNLKPISVRLKEAEKMLDDGASYAEVKRTLHLSDRALKREFPNRGWTNKQCLEYALEVRYGEQRINKIWASAKSRRLTNPPLGGNSNG